MKIMTIIMLIGKSNCGKTTTCKCLYQELITNNAKIIKTTYKEKCGDFSCKLNYNEKIIVIKSAGDSRNRVSDALKKQCDILICACRSSFNDIITSAMQEASSFSPIDKEKTSDENAKSQIINIINQNIQL